MDAHRRFYISIGLLVGFFATGILGYMFIEGASLLDAAYMTIITLSTVGYTESVELNTTAGSVFTIVFIMAGVGTVFYASTSLVALFVSGELDASREKIKVKKRINELRGHIVICGFGRMGQSVVEQLPDHLKDVVVIEIDPDRIVELERDGILHLKADASEEASLQEAGIVHAKFLVATLPKDALNVYVTLTARGLNADLMIIARAESNSTESKLLRAGANRVVCPQLIGASRILGLLTRPNVVDFVDVAAQGIELQLDEYLVDHDSPLVGKSLREAQIRQKVDAIVVAIKREVGKDVFNPSADEVLQARDTMILIGKLNTAERLAEL